MLDTLASWLQLSPTEALVLLAGVLIASIVRGFSGFALTATMMAVATLVLAPIDLLTICLILEAAAGVFMIRAGLRDADLRLVFSLMAGSIVGIPIGLSLTTTISPELSRVLTQCLILLLALSQLLKLQPRWLAGPTGRLLAGFISGIATGVAGMGGMVIAVFVIVQNLPARVVRGSLVVYLFAGLLISGGFQYAFGVMTPQAISRGLILAPLCVLGVLAGQQLFRPGWEYAYRKVCLWLLIGLALLGLSRTVL